MHTILICNVPSTCIKRKKKKKVSAPLFKKRLTTYLYGLSYPAMKFVIRLLGC